MSDGGIPPQELGNEPGKKTPWIIFIVLVVVVLAGIAALNQMNIIHLWGHRQARVVEALPEAAPATPSDSAALAVSPAGAGSSPGGTIGKSSGQPPAPRGATKSPRNAAAEIHTPAAPPTGGIYSVQVSSWITKERANAVAEELGSKGFHAYVLNAVVDGEPWYRVRVGNYETSKEASDALTSLENLGYGGLLYQGRK